MFHRNSSQSDADKIRTIKELLSVKAGLVALSSFDASQVDFMIQTLCTQQPSLFNCFYLYVVRFHNKYNCDVSRNSDALNAYCIVTLDPDCRLGIRDCCECDCIAISCGYD